MYVYNLIFEAYLAISNPGDIKNTIGPIPTPFVGCVFAHNGTHLNTLLNQLLRVSQIGKCEGLKVSQEELVKKCYHFY